MVDEDGAGRRSVSAEVEVAATPEEVWQAIATGPGISAWFVPTELDGRVGGETTSHFAPDGSMNSVATITEWEPQRRFAAESDDGHGPGVVATEWLVEARSGGTCVVRVVHSWAAEGDEWDAEFEGHAGGWLSFFRILRLYVEHFAGQPSALVQVAAQTDATHDEAWRRLAGPLGLVDADEGRSVSSDAEAPALAGLVEEAQYTPEGCSAILRLEEPAPGVAHLLGFPMGGPTHLSVRFYLYGEHAARTAGPLEERWRRWLDGRFAVAS